MVPSTTWERGSAFNRGSRGQRGDDVRKKQLMHIDEGIGHVRTWYFLLAVFIRKNTPNRQGRQKNTQCHRTLLLWKQWQRFHFLGGHLLLRLLCHFFGCMLRSCRFSPVSNRSCHQKAQRQAYYIQLTPHGGRI